MGEQQDDDFPLPSLSPVMKLFSASPDREGKPRWSLYHPATNKYYYIRWTEFECLARFHKHESAAALVQDVNAETTLDIDLDDVKALVLFLQGNGLLALDHTAPQPPDAGKPLWERIVHGYLFFTIPLFKPGGFLKATLPFIRPFLSRTFLFVMVSILMIGIILTIQRFDEFTHTFLEMFSVRGAILTFLAFTVIKIIHEFSHAYIATKYGVNVPHMGAAFIVMYPVLYTETSGAWRLSSKQQRIEIGLAGVMAELALAAIALILWHILPPGMGQSVAFSVVAISLIGSLFVNLNPLMRFDGYFVLSDALNIENLHARAIALARWRLRKTLFGLQGDAPDQFPPALQKFMQIFGFAIMIYRFFLFLGIAFLVYYVFFKPLGLAMMLLELFWFIGLPIVSELKIWWEKRADIISQKRSRITGALTLAALVFLLLPLHTGISVSGIKHAAQQRSVYPPSPSFIRSLMVEEGERVKEGQMLATLESDALERDFELAAIKLKNLQKQMRGEKMDMARFKEYGSDLQNRIAEARQVLENLKKQKQRLIVLAPFDGIIRDLSPEIHENRSISTRDLLLRVVGTDENSVTAYIGEDQLERLKIGATAKFSPGFSLFQSEKLVVTNIDPVNIKTLTRPELASIYGGNIPVSPETGGLPVPLEPTYAVYLKSLKKIQKVNDNTITQKGLVRIQARRESVLIGTFKRFIALIIREIGLN